MDIGTRIRNGRKAQGVTQEELARRAGVTLSLVSKIERGLITDLHFSTLFGVSRALGVPISELIGEEPAVPLGEAPLSPPPEAADEERRLADIDAAERLLEWLRAHEANREDLQKARRALRRMAAAIEEIADHGAATLDYVEHMDKLSTSIGEALYGSFGLMAGFDALSKNDAELTELHETTQSQFWELRATVDAAWKPAMDKYFGRDDARKRADVTDINTKERQHADREQRLKELKAAAG